jgi:hypothetical protein
MKQMIFLFTTLAIAFVVATPAQAQGDPPPQLAGIDAKIQQLIPDLETFQSEYVATKSRYFQALPSHSQAPDSPTAPDRISSRPTDQVETLGYFWNNATTLPAEQNWSISIDVYRGPLGRGYVLNVETKVDGQIWRRSINFGPEPYRHEPWHAITVTD